MGCSDMATRNETYFDKSAAYADTDGGMPPDTDGDESTRPFLVIGLRDADNDAWTHMTVTEAREYIALIEATIYRAALDDAYVQVGDEMRTHAADIDDVDVITDQMAVAHAINTLRRPEDPWVAGAYPIEDDGSDTYKAYHLVLTAHVEGKIDNEGNIL